MVRLIRALPLATLGCMLVTTVVPISGMGGDSEALRVTSLGMSVRELDDLALPYVIVWAAVVALAVAVWLLKSHRIWGIAAITVAAVMALWLNALWLDPPSLIWDGFNVETGQPTGGHGVAESQAGMAVLSAGAAALALAGVLGLPRRQRPVPVNP